LNYLGILVLVQWLIYLLRVEVVQWLNYLSLTPRLQNREAIQVPKLPRDGRRDIVVLDGRRVALRENL
jgi:hypothetical protein